MNIQRASIVLVACASLAIVPTAAWAQSAGDDQYIDPLGGAIGGGSGSDGTAVGEGAAGVAGSAEAGAARLPSELARTGAELPLFATAGLLLLAGGVGLRRLSGERR